MRRPRLRSVSRKRPIGLAVVIATISVASWVMIVPSSSAGEGGAAALSGGVLLVHFGGGSDAYFLWDQDANLTTTSDQVRETIAAGASPCIGVVNGDAAHNLVAVSAVGTGTTTPGLENPNNVGIIGMGVNSARENAQDCGRISQAKNESLTIALDGLLGGFVIDKAELDMDAKYSATIRTTLSLDGNALTTQPPDVPTTASGDSGADATSKDNFSLPLNGFLFDSIKLEGRISGPSGQKFAAATLEGGRTTDPRIAGGLRATLGTFDTAFHLLDVDGVLGCNENTGNNAVEEDGVTVVHYTGEGCVPVPYRLVREEQSVTFLQPLNGQKFNITVDAWDPEPAVNPIPVTQVDTPSPSHDLQWCGGTPSAPTIPGSEVTCRISITSEIVGGGDMQVTEVIYLEGDINYRR